MPYRMLCNDAQREDAKLSPNLASGLFCHVPLYKVGYSIQITDYLAYKTANIDADKETS
jgi:hypothetical protein